MSRKSSSRTPPVKPRGEAARVQVSRPGTLLRRGRAAVVLFLGSFLIYNANLRPVHSGDTFALAMVPFAVIVDGGIQLDSFAAWAKARTGELPYYLEPHGGHFYARHPMLQSWLLTPLYVPVCAALGVGSWSLDDRVVLARIVEKIFASLLTALSLVVLYNLLCKLTSPGTALFLSLVYGFATSAWSVCSQALWPHTGGSAAIILALWSYQRSIRSPGLRRYVLMLGLWCGIALMVRPTNLALTGAFAAILAFRRQLRDLLLFCLPVIPCGVVTAAVNYWEFGTVRGMYISALEMPSLQGLANVLASPSRGLFIYSPILVLSLVGGLLIHREPDRDTRLLYWICLLFSTAHILLVSVVPFWFGGNAWGPRLLSEASPCLVILMVPAMRLVRPRVLVQCACAALLVASVFVQFLGAFSYPKGLWDDRPVSISVKSERLWDWQDTQIRRALESGLVLDPHVFVWIWITEGRQAAMSRWLPLRSILTGIG